MLHKKSTKIDKTCGKIFVLDSMFRILWMVTVIYHEKQCLIHSNFKNCLSYHEYI